MSVRALLAALLLPLLGCTATYERGRFAVASVRAVDLPAAMVEIVDPEAEGRSCATVFDARYELAVSNAIIRAPGSNALVNATYTFERLCIKVRGTAVRVAAPEPTPTPAPE